MPSEHSAGIIPFYQRGEKRKYLLLLSGITTARDYWEFPKGLIEKGESLQDAAIREFHEETGLARCTLIPGFKQLLKYVYKRDGQFIFKTVTYFIGKTTSMKVKISWESRGFAWAEREEILQKVKHKNLREIFLAADAFLGNHRDTETRR